MKDEILINDVLKVVDEVSFKLESSLILEKTIDGGSELL